MKEDVASITTSDYMIIWGKTFIQQNVHTAKHVAVYHDI